MFSNVDYRFRTLETSILQLSRQSCALKVHQARLQNHRSAVMKSLFLPFCFQVSVEVNVESDSCAGCPNLAATQDSCSSFVLFSSQREPLV